MSVSGVEEFVTTLQTHQKAVEAGLDRVLRTAAYDVAESIIVGSPDTGSPGTPVDTGFARRSWWVSLNSPGEPHQPGSNPDPTRTQRYVAWDWGPQLLDAKIGDTVYILSNCVYMRSLEHGHSQAQAPLGMIRLTLSVWDAIVERAVQAVRAADEIASETTDTTE
jgi:hypothetical protein